MVAIDQARISEEHAVFQPHLKQNQREKLAQDWKVSCCPLLVFSCCEINLSETFCCKAVATLALHLEAESVDLQILLRLTKDTFNLLMKKKLPKKLLNALKQTWLLHLQSHIKLLPQFVLLLA